MIWRDKNKNNYSNNTENKFFWALRDTNTVLAVEKVMRSVAGKRMVVKARWNNQDVIAKCFLREKAWPRDLKRELDGVRALEKAGIATVELLYEGARIEGGAGVLIYKILEQAKTVHSEVRDVAKAAYFGHQMIRLLAKHHAAGIEQTDLHLDNFLLTDNKIYTLDGAAIVARESALSEKACMKNLALYFAQFPPDYDMLIPRLMDYYGKFSNFSLTEKHKDGMKRAVVQQRDQRKRQFLKKTTRFCSRFRYWQRWQYRCGLVTHHDGEPLRELLYDPGAQVDKAGAEYLKQGRRSTVAKVTCQGERWVVKRHRPGLLKGWLTVWLPFQSRAFKAWHNAHLLQFYAIPSAEPVAFFEDRTHAVLRESCFVSKIINGVRLWDVMTDQGRPMAEKRIVAKNTVTLLKQLQAVCLCHGDLKALNIIVEGEQPYLVDVDGMKQYSSWLYRYKREKDWQRFFENWQEYPDIEALFIELFKENGEDTA